MEENILTKEEVLQNGVCFEEELDWGGWYYEQIVCGNESGGRNSIYSLNLQLYPDSKLSIMDYILKMGSVME